MCTKIEVAHFLLVMDSLSRLQQLETHELGLTGSSIEKNQWFRLEALSQRLAEHDNLAKPVNYGR